MTNNWWIATTVEFIAIAFMAASLLHGLANTVDWIAYKLHLFAKSLREMQRRRSCTMEERWVREIERIPSNSEIALICSDHQHKDCATKF